MSDLRRREFITDFIRHPERSADGIEKLGKLKTLPGFVQAVVNPYITNRQMKSHFGQVVPIEECEKIFDSLGSIVRIACYCRHSTLGREHRYCYCLSMAPNGGMMADLIRQVDVSYLTGPDTSGLEILTKREALASLKQHEKEGLCHTVWTFVTPFIGAICNCDRTDCLAMRATVGYGFPIMFRSEFIAEIIPGRCTGCRRCMQVCQFGAIGFSAGEKKSRIDPARCYGCGICRSSCESAAIVLQKRAGHPVAGKLW
ncbi:4Fe-4S binding protein [Dehalogenimonas formicexedens]|nr:4Fe-4S binding protein [Dehalogenimonas formicexedens]